MIQELYQQLVTFIHSNQFASGGLLLGILGGLAVYLRNIPHYLKLLFLRRFSTSVEITNTNELFFVLEYWFAKNKLDRTMRSFMAKYRYSPPSLIEDDDDLIRPSSSSKDNKIKTQEGLQLSPGIGTHWFWFEKTFCLISRSRRDVGVQKSSSEKFSEEVFELRFLTRDIEKVKRFFYSAISISDVDFDNIKIYGTSYDRWTLSSKKDKKKSNTLVLKKGMLEDLIQDISQFNERKSWYYDRGIPHRRGFLLTGEPGNGKTSTILTLASLFSAPIYVLDFSSPDMYDTKLSSLISSLPKGAFLVIEDIDAIFKKRKPDLNKDDLPDDNKSGVTFSGLLNALDGLETSEGYCLFMTTNYPELLDPALIRPGRVDKIINFSNADEAQARNLALKFFPESADITLESFSKKGGKEKYSMAKLQEVLLRSVDLKEAIKLLGK